ncbi:MAG: DUF4145 domain-containing protein [Sedimentisphaerales bacterium]|nr:DUF4145 domain-containing protein [Sedimentisphaerales bacterium]
MSPKTSAAISRRLLQNLLRDEMRISNSNLSKQIDSFLEMKGVPSHLSASIDAIRNIGNFTAHPNKETSTGEIIVVKPGEANGFFKYLCQCLIFYSFNQSELKLDGKS